MFNRPGKAPQKKPKDLKSHIFRFRLHPEIAQEKWALDAIEWYEGQGIGLRELVVKALMAYAEVPTPPPPDNLYAVELQRIGSILEEINTKIEGGGAVNSTQPKQGKNKEGKLTLPKAAINTLQDFLATGVYAEDDD